MNTSDGLEHLHDARQGDPDALGKLLEFYRPWLLERARASHETALRVKVSDSDLVQKTFVQALEHFHQFRGSTALELRNWLAAILKHQLVDAVRQFRAARMRDIFREMTLSKAELAMKHPVEDELSPELVERLVDAIENLPEDHRTIVRARYLEGKTFEVIAEECNMSRERVRRRWLAAIDALARQLDD